MSWNRGRGVSNFYLDVYVENRAAIRAYKKVGFISNQVEMKLNSSQ
jgi:RimJ/RimL family protein N-acetyltransferase